MARHDGLKRSIGTAKAAYKERIEFVSLWSDIQQITNYRSSRHPPSGNSASLAEELNHFFDKFEKDLDNVCLKSHEGLVGIQTGSSKIVHSGL